MVHLGGSHPGAEPRPVAFLPEADADSKSAAPDGGRLATLLHEVRQPLMVVANYVGVAQRNLLPDGSLFEVGVYLERLSQWVDFVGDVVHQLEVLTGAKPVEFRPIDLNDVASDAVSLVRDEAEEMEVELLTALQPDIPMALADRVLVMQSLRNVVQNAVQAEAAARIDQRRVTLSTGRRESGEPIVRVSDNGDGISQDAMTRVFKMTGRRR